MIWGSMPHNSTLVEPSQNPSGIFYYRTPTEPVWNRIDPLIMEPRSPHETPTGALVQVCKIVAFYRCWAIILPTFGGLQLMNVDDINPALPIIP